MDKTQKQLLEYKTLCCKSGWYKKGRANYRCNKCDDDITLELTLFYDMLTN